MDTDLLSIGNTKIKSRLFTGSGKYGDDRLMLDVALASECDVITVALRRVDFEKGSENILNYIPKNKIILPNTSGARNAQEAVRIAKLSKAMGCGNWIKIEVITDQKYLLPDNYETIKATEILASEGFIVLPYINPDLTDAKRLVNAGASAVMPLGAPIGTNRGLKASYLIDILINEIDLPVIVDAGIGKPSHAAKAMEMGAAAVLLNTAIATSDDPVKMAKAFKHAVIAGRLGYLAKPGSVSDKAQASSPLTGFLN